MWVYFEPITTGLNRKLLGKFEGPFTVIDKIDSVTYRVRNDEKLFATHVQRLRPYYAWSAKHKQKE